ncbi:hypothetical protein [Desertibacillus haloalkaliphilus]|nr:hypothetical protein [Desertibacillus haloalkaliphilus]
MYFIIGIRINIAENNQSLKEEKERFDQLMEQLRARKLAAEKG